MRWERLVASCWCFSVRLIVDYHYDLSDGEFLMLLLRPAAVNDVPVLLRFFLAIGGVPSANPTRWSSRKRRWSGRLWFSTKFRGLIRNGKTATGYCRSSLASSREVLNLPRGPLCTGTFSAEGGKGPATAEVLDVTSRNASYGNSLGSSGLE